MSCRACDTRAPWPGSGPVIAERSSAAARKAAATGDVADVAAGQLELPGEEVEVDVVAGGAVVRQVALPQPAPVRLVGQREVDDDVEPAHERLVDVAAQVRRQDGQRRRTSPCAAAGRRPRCWRTGRARRCTSERLPKRASASSKSSTPLTRSASAKMRSRFFSVSPMYLSTTVDEVDDVEVEAEVAGDDLGGHRLAGAGVAGEERGDARGRGRRRAHAATRRAPARGGGRDAASSRSCGSVPVGQHEVVPADARARCAGPGARGRRRSAGGRRARRSSTVTGGRPSSAASVRRAAAARADCGAAGRPVLAASTAAVEVACAGSPSAESPTSRRVALASLRVGSARRRAAARRGAPGRVPRSRARRAAAARAALGARATAPESALGQRRRPARRRAPRRAAGPRARRAAADGDGRRRPHEPAAGRRQQRVEPPAARSGVDGDSEAAPREPVGSRRYASSPSARSARGHGAVRRLARGGGDDDERVEQRVRRVVAERSGR